MSRYLNARTSIPWKVLGQGKIWSDPTLIETQLLATFDQWKDAKKRTHFHGNQNYRIRYSTCFSIQRRLASIIWKIIATVLTSKPGHSLKCMGHVCPRLHAIANLTMFRSFATKNRGRNNFSLLRSLRYFFFISHLPNGALKFNTITHSHHMSFSILLQTLIIRSSAL